MDSFYGPVRFKGEDKINNFDKARKIVAERPALIGEHAIDPDGAIASLIDPNNFSPEARLKRQLQPPGKWIYSDYTEPTKIFPLTKQEQDFQILSKDFRGLETDGWLVDDVIDEELDRLKVGIDHLDVYVMNMRSTILLGDNRVEVSQGFTLNEDLLSRRFWVFPQGNNQVGRQKFKGADITIHTLEGAKDGESSFVIPYNTISENPGIFASQIRDFMTKRDRNKEIWWSLRNPVNSGLAKYALPGAEFRWSQFVPYLGFHDGGQTQDIWVGTAGSEYVVPIRPAMKVDSTPNSHWWVTFVDSMTGEAYIHDSMSGGSGTRKTTKLIENLNWHLQILDPTIKKNLPLIRISGKAPFEPIYAPVQFAGTVQQRNSSDCGAFVLGNVTGFLERLAQDQVNFDGILQSNLLPKGWTAAAIRKRLLNIAPRVRLPLPPSPKQTH